MNGYSTTKGKCYVGDSLELLKTLDDNSINLVMTSPPFALLRQKSYGNLKHKGTVLLCRSITQTFKLVRTT